MLVYENGIPDMTLVKSSDREQQTYTTHEHESS